MDSNVEVGPGSRTAPDRDQRNSLDLALVVAARSSDRTAIEALIARMQVIARIASVLNQRLGSPLSHDDLADVGQDTAIRAWRKLEQFNGTSSLETWLCGIARRELMNALRRKRKHESAAEIDDQPAPAVGDDPVDVERLRNALAALDPEQARVIFLHNFEGLTLEQAGERLGLSQSTAKRRYYRGIERLHAFLSGRSAREAT